MAAALPVPDDPYYDYLPIDPADVQVGMDVQFFLSSWGEVVSADLVDDMWQYATQVETPWGDPLSGFAAFPADPSTQPASWWQRKAVWTREPKLDDAATLIAADGSRWIYPAGEDGRMVCYRSGTVRQRNQRLSRGAITTSPADRYVADDPDWDWMPVVDGSTVNVGDQIRFVQPMMGVVSDVVTVELTPGYKMTILTDSSSTTVGFFTEAGDPAFADLALDSTFYQRLLKPPTGTKFRADDGSRWVYTDGVYFCWGVGGPYRSGAVFHRGDVPRMAEIPGPPVTTPPLIREVLQTPDDLTTAYTLTTSGSVVAGDVLVIICATNANSMPADPTSSAGTLTQIGADAANGIGDGVLRVYRCPVGASGAQSVSVPVPTSGFFSLAAVLVLTDDATSDGFGKRAYAVLFTDPVETPSVSTTGDADLVVGIAFETSPVDFDMSASGLTQRANPRVTSGPQLSVGTAELAASGASPEYAIHATPPVKAATVAVAWKK